MILAHHNAAAGNRLSRSRWRIPVLLLIGMLGLAGCAGRPTSADRIGHAEYGRASFYASKHQGKRTASGERFDQAASTAAHRTLPFGSRVRVTNLSSGKSVIVRINDRGPFVRGRIIDLSRTAFSRLASLRAGTIRVKLEVVD